MFSQDKIANSIALVCGSQGDLRFRMLRLGCKGGWRLMLYRLTEPGRLAHDVWLLFVVINTEMKQASRKQRDKNDSFNVCVYKEVPCSSEPRRFWSIIIWEDIKKNIDRSERWTVKTQTGFLRSWRGREWIRCCVVCVKEDVKRGRKVNNLWKANKLTGELPNWQTACQPASQRAKLIDTNADCFSQNHHLHLPLHLHSALVLPAHKQTEEIKKTMNILTSNMSTIWFKSIY